MDKGRELYRYALAHAVSLLIQTGAAQSSTVNDEIEPSPLPLHTLTAPSLSASSPVLPIRCPSSAGVSLSSLCYPAPDTQSAAAAAESNQLLSTSENKTRHTTISTDQLVAESIAQKESSSWSAEWQQSIESDCSAFRAHLLLHALGSDWKRFLKAVEKGSYGMQNSLAEAQAEMLEEEWLDVPEEENEWGEE